MTGPKGIVQVNGWFAGTVELGEAIRDRSNVRLRVEDKSDKYLLLRWLCYQVVDPSNNLPQVRTAPQKHCALLFDPQMLASSSSVGLAAGNASDS